MDNLRITWVVSHPIQYYAPLFKELSKFKELNLTVCYLSRRGTKPYFDKEFSKVIQFDTDLINGYNHIFLRNFSSIKNSLNFFAHINPGIASQITRNSDTVVFQSWNSVSSFFGILLCILTKKRFYIRSDSNMLGVAFKTNLVGKLKRIVKNIFIVPLLKKCTGVLTIGARNEDYFRYLGINDSKFLRVPFSVDTKIFTQSIEGKMEMKSRFCLEYNFDPKKKIFLFVGKIRVSKGVFDLLDQASQLPESYFVFVGDGTDFDRFEKLSKALPNVLIMGFRNQSELPAIYGAADFIILPSHYESWGLSVNEGIAAGCVPIVSDVCGCSPELVETTSKLIFESQNRMSLLKVLQDSLLLQDSKKVYLDLLKVSSEHSIESSADKFVKVILNS